MEKSFRTRYDIIFVLIIISFLCASCIIRTKERHYCSNTPTAKLTLALRAGTYADVIKSCIPAFEKENNIMCTVMEFSEDALHKAVVENPEGKYDLCMVDGSWMAEFTSNGALANLTELGYELDDDIIGATKSICYSDGSLYLAPYYGNVTVLLYNKIMLKEAGYTPETVDSLEDIYKICLFQKKRHNLGFMIRGDTENNIVVDFLPILLAHGAWVVDENNYPTVNTKEFAEAMEMYMKLLKTGRAAKKNDFIAAIANKSAAFGIGWPGWYTPTRNSPLDYIAFSGKATKDGKKYNANIYGIWTLGISEKSASKKDAALLLEYLMDKNVQRKTVEAGGVPCRYSSLKDPEVIKKFPQYKPVCDALESGIYRPVMRNWKEFYTILGKEMRLIISGEKNISDGLCSAQEKLEAEITKDTK
ncbi:MAG: extracellular solute-binding protein [Treponema sp.]|nr:extracellular solute-binding protein [Treponema sp.]